MGLVNNSCGNNPSGIAYGVTQVRLRLSHNLKTSPLITRIMAKGNTGKTQSTTEMLVLNYAASMPELGQFRVADALFQRGIQISPSAVRAIWKRHNLETLYKRVSAIEQRGPGSGPLMTEAQRARFRRAEHRLKLLKDVENEDRGGRSQPRRHHLLVAAAKAFLHHGYKGATLKGIAETGGILPGSIYHYFRSKEDLYVQVHDEGFKDLNATVTQALAHVTDPASDWRLPARLT